jgi:hypothetical protein
MSANILFFNDEESRGKINIDELYEKNLQRDLKQLSIFNKILNRIHKRIQTIARNKRNDKHAWFLVPNYMFGEPTYDQGDCIAYLISKLVDNGFHIRYIHPSTLFISWENWIPSYVRNEIKKKTGKVIDEKGQVISDSNDEFGNKGLFNTNASNNPEKIDSNSNPKKYTPIDEYKPSGNLVYKPELFYRINMKTTDENGGKNT